MTEFDKLWEGYIAGTLKSGEVRELLERINQEEGLVGENIHALLEDQLLLGLAAPGEKEMILQQIMERVQQPRVRRMYWKSWVAAAAVFLFFCTGTYFWYQHYVGTSMLVAANKVIPGSDKAILTLANGAAVALDNTGSSVLQQGNIAIHQHNGQLKYTVNGTSKVISNNTLTTPRGGQYNVILPDGTSVWLNSASSLQYPTAFTGKERVVTLTGQAYFEVAINAAQPFKVKVNGMEVQVLGTAFDIMAYADEQNINTTLVEGAVKVISPQANAVLKPGQQASLNNSLATLSVKTADVNKVMAWRNGLFIFNNTDLETIMREIARWYDVEIVNEAGNSSKLYGGSISRRKDLRNVLNLLEAGGNNHFKIEGRKVIILK
jgi:transmembrane sensor